MHFQIDLVSRVNNSQADALSKLASSTLQSLTRTVMVEVVKESSIAESKQVNCTRQQRAWFTDITDLQVTWLAARWRGTSQESQKRRQLVRGDEWGAQQEGLLKTTAEVYSRMEAGKNHGRRTLRNLCQPHRRKSPRGWSLYKNLVEDTSYKPLS